MDVNSAVGTISLVFLILAFTTILSTRLKISPVLFEIGIGILIGPYVLNIVQLSPELLFLKELGLIILLFLAGLDFNFKNLREKIRDAILIAIPPGIVGFGLIFVLVPLNWFTRIELLVLALILTTTSISLSVSVLKEKMKQEEDNYDTVVLAIIISNVAMILVAGVLTQTIVNERVNFRVVLRNFLLVLSFIVLILLLSQKVKFVWHKGLDVSEEQMEYIQTKFAFGLLGFILFISFLLGIELAVAAFFAGVYIKETTDIEKSSLTKFNVIGYGFLIPIFFITMGMEVNPAYFIVPDVFVQVSIIIALSFIFQVLLTAFSSYLANFSLRESIIIGIGLSACSLSGGFAVLEIANRSGVIENQTFSIFTAVITLSVLLTILGLEIFERILPVDELGTIRDMKLVAEAI